MNPYEHRYGGGKGGAWRHDTEGMSCLSHGGLFMMYSYIGGINLELLKEGSFYVTIHGFNEWMSKWRRNGVK